MDEIKVQVTKTLKGRSLNQYVYHIVVSNNSLKESVTIQISEDDAHELEEIQVPYTN